MKITSLKNCRCCQSETLISLFSLGSQYLTGVFPQKGQHHPPQAPLDLILCDDCGLVQLEHSCEPEFLYGPTYGYRSGLNDSMRKHLKQTADHLTDYAALTPDDVICDIGCNDGTLLSYFETDGLVRIGIDPLGSKFQEYHPDHTQICSNFFSRSNFETVSSRPAKLITSLSMFYDLENPVEFVKDVRECLDDEGVWFFEQSYLWLMLKTNSYDTICHEHLEYYSLEVIDYILKQAEMRIVDLSLNDVNGGSMAVSAVKERSARKISSHAVSLLEAEKSYGLREVETYQRFISQCQDYGETLKQKLIDIKNKGQKVAGYGASTKGNVLLQYLGITEDLLPFIIEINEEKRGRVTPGTNIPICLEDEVDMTGLDYIVVLPWHFRDGILSREQTFLNAGGKFIFPLPEMEIYPVEL